MYTVIYEDDWAIVRYIGLDYGLPYYGIENCRSGEVYVVRVDPTCCDTPDMLTSRESARLLLMGSPFRAIVNHGKPIGRHYHRRFARAKKRRQFAIAWEAAEVEAVESPRGTARKREAYQKLKDMLEEAVRS